MPKKIPVNMQSSCMNCEAREFAWFEPDSADFVLAERQKHRSSQLLHEPGEYLFNEGEVHGMAYTLKEGWAICYKQLKDGQRQVVHIALPGDFLGYQTNFDEPIDYSVVAITKCVFCAFNPVGIDSLLAQDMSLIKRLMEIQNKQNSACKLKLSVLGQARTKNKVAFFLADLINRLEERNVDVSGVIHIPLNREDIADAVGVTSVHLSRVITDLTNSNILECRHRKLRVLSSEKLQGLAEAAF